MIARLHWLAGLLTLVNLTVYGVAGIAALAERRGAPAPVVWEQPFEAPPGASDRAVAERVVQVLGLRLATPVHDFAVQRDARGLVLDFYHANGRHRVEVLPGRLRVAHTRASLWQYLSTLHVTTGAFRSGDWRMQAWAWWNEFAMWCLAAMLLSGVWTWWQRRGTRGTVRRVHRWVGLAALAPIGIYEVSAISMAHRAWFRAETLNRLHGMRGLWLSAGVGVALLAMGATGMVLWWRMPRERRAGAAMLGCGLLLAGGLAIWMRTG